MIITGMEKGRAFRPDVAVSESWKHGISPAWQTAGEDSGEIALAEPVVMRVIEETLRWIEIREAGGRLITVIEVLSPANKSGDGWNDYRRKQQAYLSSHVNLVEIDLLRGGEHVLAFPRKDLEAAAAFPYMICVCRTTDRWQRHEYPIPLRQRLPAIAIPLRETDAGIPLDLQPLVDRAYENGRHWQEDFTQPLDPPVEGDEQTWVAERLQAAGLAE